MISFLKKHRLYFLFQAIALVILACVTIFKEAGLNDGDSITHYLISRYAWHYPHLFFDNWGKPFFILLSTPFAQFGYGGIQFFNILCATLSGWFCYRIADKLGLKFPCAAPIFLFMTPVYLNAMPSGLTEILFGLVLIASVYLMQKEKNLAAAILVSFLPFCRSEGFLLLPMFGLILLYRRKFFVIPLLAFGYIAYSIAGYLYLPEHDIMWIKHSNPYHGGTLYGSGSLWSFIAAYIPIFGNILGILFVFATTWYLAGGFAILRNSENRFNITRFEFVMTWLSVMVYVAAHSIFWYLGIFGSLGMWRVMAAIAPIYILVCMRGLTWGMYLIAEKNWAKIFLDFVVGILETVVKLVALILRKGIWLVVFFLIVYQPIHYFRLPMHMPQQNVLVRNACNWVKENHLQNRKIFYSSPFTKMCLNLDPYDNEKSQELMYVWHGDGFGKDMKPGSIIIWESGLGPREDGLPLDLFQKDTARFKPLKTYEFEHPADKPAEYGVYVFERK